jgi:hypothetical protein
MTKSDTPSATVESDFRRRWRLHISFVALVLASLAGLYWLSGIQPRECRERMERRYVEGVYSLLPERAHDAAIVYCSRLTVTGQ